MKDMDDKTLGSNFRVFMVQTLIFLHHRIIVNSTAKQIRKRVLYSQEVQHQLLAEEPNIAMRVLFPLLTIVFCQILIVEKRVFGSPCLRRMRSIT